MKKRFSGFPETNSSLCPNKYFEMSKGNYELGLKRDALTREPIFEQISQIDILAKVLWL